MRGFASDVRPQDFVVGMKINVDTDLCLAVITGLLELPNQPDTLLTIICNDAQMDDFKDGDLDYLLDEAIKALSGYCGRLRPNAVIGYVPMPGEAMQISVGICFAPRTYAW